MKPANKSCEHSNGIHFKSLMTKIGYIKRQFVCTKSHAMHVQMTNVRRLIRFISFTRFIYLLYVLCDSFFSALSLSFSLSSSLQQKCWHVYVVAICVYALPFNLCDFSLVTRQMQIKSENATKFEFPFAAKRNETKLIITLIYTSTWEHFHMNTSFWMTASPIYMYTSWYLCAFTHPYTTNTHSH